MAHVSWLLFILIVSSMLHTSFLSLVMPVFHPTSHVTIPLIYLQHSTSTNLSTTMLLKLLHSRVLIGALNTTRTMQISCRLQISSTFERHTMLPMETEQDSHWDGHQHLTKLFTRSTPFAEIQYTPNAFAPPCFQIINCCVTHDER
jgi:hypothetical protein